MFQKTSLTLVSQANLSWHVGELPVLYSAQPMLHTPPPKHDEEWVAPVVYIVGSFMPKATCKTAFFMAGTETTQVHAIAVSTMLMAAKGKASGSLTKAAVPSP